MSLLGRVAAMAALPVTTSARLAGAAASTLLGADKDDAYARATTASIEALAGTLAKSRGPAMKFGQILALLSTGLPDDQATALSALTRLYENAQPLPISTLRDQLTGLPDGVTIEPAAVAAASLGQVHRGTWTDGTPVAVKVQYRDALKIVRSDMTQLRALTPVMSRLLPSFDVPALLTEHAHRLEDELDYRHEADWQETFRTAWADTEIAVPAVRHSTTTLLVTDWIDGTPFAQLADRPAPERDTAGRALARFCLWSPRLVGASHADPHPGNFRLLPDGRLAVLDFGSVAAGSGVFTRLFADTMHVLAEDDYDQALQLWDDCGMLAAGTTAEQLAALLGHDIEPYTADQFTFTPAWLQARSNGWLNPSAALEGANKLTFPPEYLLEHRAIMGTLALLASISATVDFRAVVDAAHSWPPSGARRHDTRNR